MSVVPEVLAERYELLEVIGRGGMGVVYRGRDRVLERVVAVKVLPLDRAVDPATVARFVREARAAASLNHPHIVTVFDSGADGEVRFIVMECLEGENLAELLHARGPLDAVEAVDLVAQVADALAAAHRAGLIHRDIKPANVMVDARGQARVLDFGIARLVAGAALTQTATVLGSAPYLAPELCRGEPADARSDIYALGCVLYELLTGRPPFTGEMPAAVVHQQLSADPSPPDALVPGLPAALSGLTLAMLEKDPARRPPSADALRDALGATLVPSPLSPDPAEAITRPLRARSAREAPTVPLVQPTLPLMRPAAATHRNGHGREPGRGRPAVAAVILAALLALALVGLAGAFGGARRVSARTRGAAAPHATTRTAPVRPAASTTLPAKPAPSVPAAPPAGRVPPGHGAGGPHDKVPPGQAKKQAAAQGENDQ